MAAMNAIEIADGEHCALGLRRDVPPTGDDIHPCVHMSALSLRYLSASDAPSPTLFERLERN
jgi:hypothetical protein